MPAPLQIRKQWIEERLVDEFGRPIRCKPWMVEHVLKPLDGYRAWRRSETLCDPCKRRVGDLRPVRRECEIAAHDGCGGTDGYKVVLDVVNLMRQQGKTTTGAAYSLSELFLGKNSNILYLAAAEDQSERVFKAKWVTPIMRNPRLASKVSIHTNEIRYEKKGNYFRFVPTSAKSVPGGSWRLLIIDEARDVREDVAMALIPSILSAQGLECPWGHYTCGREASSPTHCPACATLLDEWQGRVLIMSSAGEDSGWFRELVDQLEREPDPSAHLYRSTEVLNPHTSVETIAAIERTLGKLPSMQGLVQRELHNEFTREGDEFLPPKAIAAVTNDALRPVETSDLRCVGFLDCSRTNELTSLVIAGDPASADGAPSSFSQLQVLRVDVWDPRASAGGRVDYKAIRAHLEHLLASVPPRFPSLLELAIDVSLLQDAEELADWCRRQPWGGRVRAFRADRLTNQLMWQHLEQRVLSGRDKIELLPHKRMLDELKAARVRIGETGLAKVVDSVRGDRRGRLHRDVAMALAGCCYIAAKYASAATGGSVARRINNSIRLASKFKPTIGAEIGKGGW